jgi:hypothetical protein
MKKDTIMKDILAMKAKLVGRDKKKKHFDQARSLAAAIAYKKVGEK